MPDLWCIYHVKNDIHAVPRPKNKFVAIVCVDPGCIGFFINSEIAPFILHNPELLKHQVKIQMSKYRFLNDDSYIDCNDPYEYRKRELKEYIEPINTVTKAKIIKAITNSKVVPPRYQKMILDNS